MKTAGDILSKLFDERFVEKAQGYSKLFDSWADITSKNGIAAAADHSHIKDMDKGILIIEMDHPGWKQILQTKQGKLLNDFRRRFPELDICGLSLMLGSFKPDEAAEMVEKKLEEYHSDEVIDTSKRSINDIADDDLKESLIKLGRSIAERDKRSGASK